MNREYVKSIIPEIFTRLKEYLSNGSRIGPDFGYEAIAKISPENHGNLESFKDSYSVEPRLEHSGRLVILFNENPPEFRLGIQQQELGDTKREDIYSSIKSFLRQKASLTK